MVERFRGRTVDGVEPVKRLRSWNRLTVEQVIMLNGETVNRLTGLTSSFVHPLNRSTVKLFHSSTVPRIDSFNAFKR